METTVRFLEGVRFEAESRGLKVICDQPPENGGQNAGMTPPEFLLAALGACVGYYAVQYLTTRKLSTNGLTVKLEAGKALQPTRMDNFRIVVDAPGLDNPRHRDGILRAVKNCLVHNTMLHAPSMEVVLASVAEALKPA